LKIFIGADHRGFKLKSKIIKLLEKLGHTIIDTGSDTDKKPSDYPKFSYKVAQGVASTKNSRGILVCMTGIGHTIAANKVKGIRAVLCYDEFNARISRTHNNANVLCLPGDFIDEQELWKMIQIWLSTEFSGGRHHRRIKKIAAIEEGRDPRNRQS